MQTINARKFHYKSKTEECATQVARINKQVINNIWFDFTESNST